jgi:hypothetical protein
MKFKHEIGDKVLAKFNDEYLKGEIRIREITEYPEYTDIKYYVHVSDVEDWGCWFYECEIKYE